MRAFVVVVVAAMACGQGRVRSGEADQAPPLPNPPSLAKLTVRVDGPGSVVATGLGVDCKTGCEAAVAVGTRVRLGAAESATGAFSSWSEACTGTAACDLAVERDVLVVAHFRAVDPCEGIMPGALGQPVTATLPDPGSRRYCAEATSDGSGNVAHRVYGMGPSIWQVFDSAGASTGMVRDAFEVAPQAAGFHGLGYGDLITWNPDGTVAQTAAVSPDSGTSHYAARWLGPARTGGSVVIATDAWGCPNGNSGTSTLNVWRLSPSGSVVSVVDIGGRGCPNFASGLSDDLGNTFVAAATGYGGAYDMPRERIIARWVDARGTPLTPWTDVAPAGEAHLSPMIGGGVMLAVGSFLAAFPSGSATAIPPPIAIPERHTATVIRGGRGYAAVPEFAGWTADPPAIQLYSATGQLCGTLPFDRGAALYVGLDGTVIAEPPDNLCTANWWPQLLK